MLGQNLDRPIQSRFDPNLSFGPNWIVFDAALLRNYAEGELLVKHPFHGAIENQSLSIASNYNQIVIGYK